MAENDSRRVKFWISPVNGKESYPVEAHEWDYTIINVPSLDRDWLKSFDHLSDIEFPHRPGPIDLILGVQYSHLHAEHEVRQGLPFQPVAKRTKLGWHVIGPDNAKGSTVSYLNFANYPVKRRLDSLERSLKRNPTKAKKYNDAIREYERNGCARRLSKIAEVENTKGPVYYPPHHGIYRPKEKSTPLRIVFDPACPYQGISLNSFLYKGPYLIGGLLGVLLRFREEAVAFAKTFPRYSFKYYGPKAIVKLTDFYGEKWKRAKNQQPTFSFALRLVTSHPQIWRVL